MPVAKYYGGHGPSVRPLINYLGADGRALDVDHINCWEPDRQGRPVWQQMDVCREALGVDGNAVSVGKPLRWVQIVVSPDPKDHADVKTLKALVFPWVKEHFGSHQVAVYYHDDNRNRVAHAHVVVNAASLDQPGLRFNGAVKRPQIVRYDADLQARALSLGLSALTPLGVRDDTAVRHVTQGTFRTAADNTLELLGISWKRDVRDRILAAERVSSTEAEFVEACQALGLSVRTSEYGATAGQYAYGHPASAHDILGTTLGRDWSRESVIRRLERDRLMGVAKPTGEMRDRLLKAISSMEEPSTGSVHFALGMVGDTAVTAPKLSAMVSELCVRDVRSQDDAVAAQREVSGNEDAKRLDEALQLASGLGLLPERRPADAGCRRPASDPTPVMDPTMVVPCDRQGAWEAADMAGVDAPAHHITRASPEIGW